jgi:hypothetical protein
MGGRRFRAGRPGWRRKCEEVLPLDIRQLKSDRRLCAGNVSTWEWSCEGEPLGAVRVTVDAQGLALNYSVAQRKIEQRIEFAWTQCNFGGRRAWFACPRCRRRCAILYGIDLGGRFSCRLCMGLAYSCESEGSIKRFWRMQLKLEARLGVDGEKPKWMRWRSYRRLCERIETVEESRIHALIARRCR